MKPPILKGGFEPPTSQREVKTPSDMTLFQLSYLSLLSRECFDIDDQSIPLKDSGKLQWSDLNRRSLGYEPNGMIWLPHTAS